MEFSLYGKGFCDSVTWMLG
uniref:Uncharacterized protein n=1 Tax=Arundo donax TaxID=35708 RepID=A0A0A9HHV0_ARUDO